MEFFFGKLLGTFLDDVGVVDRAFIKKEISCRIKVQPVKIGFLFAAFCATVKTVRGKNQKLAAAQCEVLFVFFHIKSPRSYIN